MVTSPWNPSLQELRLEGSVRRKDDEHCETIASLPLNTCKVLLSCSVAVLPFTSSRSLQEQKFQKHPSQVEAPLNSIVDVATLEPEQAGGSECCVQLPSSSAADNAGTRCLRTGASCRGGRLLHHGQDEVAGGAAAGQKCGVCCGVPDGPVLPRIARLKSDIKQLEDQRSRLRGSAKATKRTRQDLTKLVNSLKDELRLVSSAGAPPPPDPGPRQALGASVYIYIYIYIYIYVCVCVCVFFSDLPGAFVMTLFMQRQTANE